MPLSAPSLLAASPLPLPSPLPPSYSLSTATLIATQPASSPDRKHHSTNPSTTASAPHVANSQTSCHPQAPRRGAELSPPAHRPLDLPHDHPRELRQQQGALCRKRARLVVQYAPAVAAAAWMMGIATVTTPHHVRFTCRKGGDALVVETATRLQRGLPVVLTWVLLVIYGTCRPAAG